jgi:lipid II:glycine glycyltransferase (peptidoglycan interpeptide bridge formation enzyme)
MKQKTRYNVRLARKKGVVVKSSADLESFYRLMLVTSQRDAFGVHDLEYYRKAYELFHPKGECVLLLAEYQGEPLAGIMVFTHGKRAWYFYGASSNQHRDRMPTYLLQWEAMRWAKSQGCSTYDLWGVPDFDLETLEADFTRRSDGLWGVYRFKRGFGGGLQRSRGSWDRVYKPSLYSLYRMWIGIRFAQNVD